MRILGTDASDKRSLEKQVLLVAQGARGTFHAQALCPRNVIVAQGDNGSWWEPAQAGAQAET